ncbi:hypothetical protein QYM36_003749, partial [Artemia franciscana]
VLTLWPVRHLLRPLGHQERATYLPVGLLLPVCHMDLAGEFVAGFFWACLSDVNPLVGSGTL